LKLDHIKSGYRGFALVELLIAVAVAILALAVIYSVFALVQKTSTSNEINARVMQNLRISIDFMESDIRMAGLDPFGSANAGIEVATATNLRFTADRNLDGTINADASLSDGLQERDLERITYFYDAANQRLRQCLSEGTQNLWDTVSENVQNFSFQYIDENNNLIAFPITDLTLIRFIEITMTISDSAGISGNVSRTITRRIFGRNLAMK
jgi:type II secretory pathway component PulJ